MCLAVPGRILSLSGSELARAARVDFGGAVREVSLAFVPEAQLGDYVVVHVGVAISRLDEEEAAATLQLLGQLGEEAGADTAAERAEGADSAAAARPPAAARTRG
ncbi:MAG: HypC/HybG/HupF family hydrogenase formation chaperone [Proteobacteria bacterium]|nr:HypC/HybG/HupF family hydrogenase formation chaperone [Pseudomonadota bacterium]